MALTLNNLQNELFLKVSHRQGCPLSTILDFIEVFRLDAFISSMRNSNQQTLLHMAARSGQGRTINYLLTKNIDVNAVDIYGRAALHYSCAHNHCTASELLIHGGAKVNVTDKRGLTPLDLIISRPINRVRMNFNYWRIVALLLESGANPYLKSKSGRTTLERVNNLDIKREIRLTHFLNAGEVDDCSYDMAVSDYFELIKNGDKKLEVLDPVIMDSTKFINCRLNESDNITPLHQAARFNQIEVADLLIRKRADVNVTDRHNRTPLHNAAQHGHVQMIELLVSERSDVNRQDIKGDTPLHVAAESNTTAGACLKLVQLGANLNVRNFGRNLLPFDLATTEEVKEVLKPVILQQKPTTSQNGVDVQSVRKDNLNNVQNNDDDPMIDSNSNQNLSANEQNNIKD